MNEFPVISIITPSLNQGKYLERTIRSVLDQDYPHVEYIIIDGGSTDGSVDIIKKYESRVKYWTSEKDFGQTNAINKGLRIATGDWVAWQNSDDIYYPGSFQSLIRALSRNRRADLIIGNIVLIDENDRRLRDVKYVKPNYNALRAEGMVLTNQAAFWRREVHQHIGYLDDSLNCGFDYEWFLRLTRGRKSAHVNEDWGALRLHKQTKSMLLYGTAKAEYREILRGRELGAVAKRIYQLRRMMFTLAKGNIRYAGRGLWQRAIGTAEFRV